jgi:membrane protein DedA with SNARE-associated domain
VADFWADWGALAYFGAAGWAFLEGETFVLLAAAAAHLTCAINLWALTGVVWLASFAGDQLWFVLGRRYGRRMLGRFRHGEKSLAVAEAFIARYGNLFILTFRFAYGVRNVASAACGIAGVSWLRFAVLNFLAAGVWAVSFVALGWFVGSWFDADKLVWLIGLAGLLIVAGMIWRYARSVRKPERTSFS